ncbi:MAG: polyprenyl synthetase family protein [Thermoplasmata archaeon]|nr:polyprenyl synthetase family protein [Candidatus Sysuiplasma acidicola]
MKEVLALDFGIGEELQMVEQTLKESVKSDSATLTEIAMHVIDAGGKRIRPAICILSYKAVGGSPNDIGSAIDAAVAVELIHSATLIHDDITDEGEKRRGRVTAYRKYGVHNALVAGDFMFVQGFKYGRFLSPEAIRIAAEAYERLAEGEMLQEQWKNDSSIPMNEYIKIVNGKTASVFSASAQLGAYHGGGSDEEIELIGEYGTDVGIAFQIVDDVLDIVSDENTLGKSVGNDIREGNMTLPLIFAMNNGVDKKLLESVISRKKKAKAMIGNAIEMIRHSGCIDESMKVAEGYIRKAVANARKLKSSPYREELIQLPQSVLARTR